MLLALLMLSLVWHRGTTPEEQTIFNSSNDDVFLDQVAVLKMPKNELIKGYPNMTTALYRQKHIHHCLPRQKLVHRSR